MSESSNLELWNRVEKTPKELVKKVDIGGGRSLSSVSSIHRIKAATKEFGMYGKKWGLKDIVHGTEKMNNLFIGTISAMFFVHSGEIDLEFPISNSTGIMTRQVVKAADGSEQVEWVANTSYMKDLETGAINKALSRLGFSADIYSDEELVSSADEKESSIASSDLIKIEEVEEDEQS